jgi:hypothetical protein
MVIHDIAPSSKGQQPLPEGRGLRKEDSPTLQSRDQIGIDAARELVYSAGFVYEFITYSKNTDRKEYSDGDWIVIRFKDQDKIRLNEPYAHAFWHINMGEKRLRQMLKLIGFQ